MEHTGHVTNTSHILPSGLSAVTSPSEQVVNTRYLMVVMMIFFFLSLFYVFKHRHIVLCTFAKRFAISVVSPFLPYFLKLIKA